MTQQSVIKTDLGAQSKDVELIDSCGKSILDRVLLKEGKDTFS